MENTALSRMLLSPTAVYLDMLLAAALKMDANKTNPACMQAPPQLVEYTKACMECNLLDFKLHALIIWIHFHPNMRKYFNIGVSQLKFDWWISILNAILPNHVFGLKLDSGNKYALDSDEDRQEGTVWYFVSYIVRMYGRA